MRYFLFVAVLISWCLTSLPTAVAERSITLLNEIDEKTGHDNHMVAVKLFGERTVITYCRGTDVADLLPLIRLLQNESDHALTLRRVHFHEFDVDRRGWVVVGICNRIKDSDPSILVYSASDVSRQTAMSIGRSFTAMRKVPVVYRPQNELIEFFTAEIVE